MADENKVKPKSFKEWCENFWYYYKYHTIIALFLFAALSISIVQCANKVDYDYKIVLATGSVEMASAQIEALNQQLSQCGEDINGDGEVTVSLIDCTFNENASSYQVIMAKKQKLQSVLMNEEEVMLIISDKTCFDWLDSTIANGFMEDLQLSKEDGRYYPLDDTKPIKKAKENCSSALNWPEDMRISHRKIKDTLFEGKDSANTAAEQAYKFIQKIIMDNNLKG